MPLKARDPQKICYFIKRHFCGFFFHRSPQWIFVRRKTFWKPPILCKTYKRMRLFNSIL